VRNRRDVNTLNEKLQHSSSYLYTYASREEEVSLCQVELHSLFGQEPEGGFIESPLKIDPSRSPFVRDRIDILFKGKSVEELVSQLEHLPMSEQTFRVVYIKNEYLPQKLSLVERRALERRLGLNIPGEPDLINPERIFAVIYVNGEWFFGPYTKSEAVWLHHQQKPHEYSTALSTRVARAVVNIAVPDPTGVVAIDPCCGIGTVLVEALSMGINIVGSDINPLVTSKARENIKHFDLNGEVVLRDIRNVMGQYDAAIIDLPYNLCSVITPKEQLEMLSSARGFTKKLVLVTVEKVDSILLEAGFTIKARCELRKGMFTREIIVCE
jgi:16S rRNA G966 N2-methylase RsmD